MKRNKQNDLEIQTLFNRKKIEKLAIKLYFKDKTTKKTGMAHFS